MAKPESLSGTAGAPFDATRRYSFRRVVGSAGDAHLVIPVDPRPRLRPSRQPPRTPPLRWSPNT